MKLFSVFRTFLEKQAFGVCTFLGERLRISSASIRLFFIYTSCLTFGSPVILYLILAFLLNIHKHLRKERSSIWDI
ncbi:MAG: PspC domain-containing protein [Cytophagaceae bacterium]|nr:PspC domain-containing protein [Cytophagaceae bacterium]